MGIVLFFKIYKLVILQGSYVRTISALCSNIVNRLSLLSQDHFHLRQEVGLPV